MPQLSVSWLNGVTVAERNGPTTLTVAGRVAPVDEYKCEYTGTEGKLFRTATYVVGVELNDDGARPPPSHMSRCWMHGQCTEACGR